MSRRPFKTLSGVFPFLGVLLSFPAPAPTETQEPVCSWHQAAGGRVAQGSCLSHTHCPQPIREAGEEEGENDIWGPENQRTRLSFPAERGRLMPGMANELRPTTHSWALVLCSKQHRATTSATWCERLVLRGPSRGCEQDQKSSHPFSGRDWIPAL